MQLAMPSLSLDVGPPDVIAQSPTRESKIRGGNQWFIATGRKCQVNLSARPDHLP
jgi:hypothetical protein